MEVVTSEFHSTQPNEYANENGHTRTAEWNDNSNNTHRKSTTTKSDFTEMVQFHIRYGSSIAQRFLMSR